jgi:hypothetical protein
VNFSCEKSTSGQNNRLRANRQSDVRFYADHCISGHNNIHRSTLENIKALLSFQPRSYCFTIQRPICLRSRCADCGALARIKPPEMNASLVCCGSHRAPQGINFFNQVALTNAAYRRITRHLAERFDTVRKQ